MEKEPTKTLALVELLPSQERLLLLLGVPALARIKMLEALGFLPAIPCLFGVGAGAHVFTETRFLLEQKDHTDGEQTLYPQVAAFLLEAGYIERTREDYDHHVTLTERGDAFIREFALDNFRRR